MAASVSARASFSLLPEKINFGILILQMLLTSAELKSFELPKKLFELSFKVFETFST